MSSKHTLFRVFYRLGFKPWDGHPIGRNLRKLVEELPAGTALDLGCGTGDASIYLAQHGWTVTGVDYVPQALDQARAKAAAAKTSVNFVHADVTRLSQEGVGTNFQLIVDNACLHNISQDDRDAYVREVSSLAAPGARLLIVSFLPGARFGVRGVEPADMERFAPAWKLLSTGDESKMDKRETPSHYYLFERENP